MQSVIYVSCHMEAEKQTMERQDMPAQARLMTRRLSYIPNMKVPGILFMPDFSHRTSCSLLRADMNL